MARELRLQHLHSIFLLLILALGIAHAATFITNTNATFSEGTFNQTFYNTTGNYTQINSSFLNGTYTSKIFTASGISQWFNISWVTGAPYGQELPNNNAVETSLGGINMSGNVLLYHLNETSGAIVDYSGNGNNGTVSGATYSASGKFNTALSFDGSNDYVNTSAPSIGGSKVFTFEAWIKPASLPNGYPVIIDHNNFDGSLFLTQSTSKMGAQTGGAWSQGDGLTPIVMGQWYHVALTYNTTYVSIYVNGVFDDGYAFSSAIGASNTVRIGSTTANNYFYNGTIDEVAIYNRSLSASELLNHYKRGALLLNLSVRSCSDISCSSANFTQINGTSPQNLSLTNNKYFQYKLNFSTENSSFSPLLYNTTIFYSSLATKDTYTLETYAPSGLARSYFAQNQTVQIMANGTYSTAPSITIADSLGNIQVNASVMTNSSGIYIYNYALNGSKGWYDVKINAYNWEKLFYQAEVWRSNSTDANGNAFPFYRPINLSEPGIISRWFEPVDIDANFNFSPSNDSIRILEYNGSAMLEIPSQFYNANQSGTTLSSARIVFLSTINKSENRTYVIASAKSSIPAAYSSDLSYSSNGAQHTVENSYYKAFFNASTGGLMQNAIDKLGTNTSLTTTEPMDYYPQFNAWDSQYGARTRSASVSSQSGPIFTVINASGRAGSTYPYTVSCRIYSKNTYMICEKNLSTTISDSWSSFYMNGLWFSNGTFTNVSYYNSSNVTTTRESGSIITELDSNMSWIAFYNTNLADGAAEIFLNKSFAVTNAPSMQILNSSGHDRYLHQIIVSSDVLSGSFFYTKTARMFYNGLQGYSPVNDTYNQLLNPLSISLGAESTSDNSTPIYSVYGNLSTNDSANATVFSYWTDDSLLDHAIINITGNGENGSSTSLYYNSSYPLHNGSSYTNESWVNITLTPGQFNAGPINANINVSDVSGKSNFTLISFNITDTTAPTFGSVTHFPNTEAELDPGVNITIFVNLTEYTEVDAAILHYKLSSSPIWNSTAMQNSSTTFFTTKFNATFNALEEGNYTYYISANDTLGNFANSNESNISIFYDYTWSLFSNLNNSTGTFSTNLSIGNITINNTGDRPLDFALRAFTRAGSFNNRIWFNNSPPANFIVPAGSSLDILVNVSTQSVESTETVTITVSNSSANPTSANTSFDLFSTAGGPILSTKITQYNSSVSHGNSNLPLTVTIINMGNETANNVTVIFALPSGWSAYTGPGGGGLSYNMGNLSADSVDPLSSSGTFSTSVDVSTAAATGSQTITAFSTCLQGKNGTFPVDVYVTSQGVECGGRYCAVGQVCCSGACAASCGDSPAGGGGGGGGGGGAPKGNDTPLPPKKIEKNLTSQLKNQLFDTVETYELVRGKDSKFYLTIKNPLSTDLQNVSVAVSGYMLQYMQVQPTFIPVIPAGENRTVEITINAPKYFTEGIFTLVFEISGTGVAQTEDSIITTSVKEKRTVDLLILEMPRQDAASYMEQANSIKASMQEIGAFKGAVVTLYEDAGLAFGSDKFGQLKQAVQKMSDLQQSAISTKERMDELEGKIATAESEQFGLPQSRRLMSMISSAFSRGDYTAAAMRLDEADLTYALETTQSFSPIAFIKKFYLQIIAGVALLSFVTVIAYLDVRYWMMKNEISQLSNEENIVVGLIKESQTDYFDQSRMSSAEYSSSIEQYDSRLSKIVERKVQLEAMVKDYLSLKSPTEKLLGEKSRLEELIRELQTDYLEKGKVETRVYENRMKSYTTRLSEIEEKIALHEAKELIRKEKRMFKFMKKGAAETPDAAPAASEGKPSAKKGAKAGKIGKGS